MNLIHEFNNYATDLEEAIHRERLPKDLFVDLDHIAVKAANTPHFEAILKGIKAGTLNIDVAEMYITPMHGRRIVVAFLVAPLALGKNWQTDILEVMEPRPEKVGKDKAGVDHMEFKVPDLGKAERHLLTTGHKTGPPSPNGHHTTISLHFGKTNREVKLTDNGLRQVIRAELQDKTTELSYTRGR